MGGPGHCCLFFSEDERTAAAPSAGGEVNSDGLN